MLKKERRGKQFMLRITFFKGLLFLNFVRLGKKNIKLEVGLRVGFD